ncbi:cation:proton antiporter [Nocardia colli]|uniref:cation:proton antiporter n=1 Tax=Nocardia colli TaxID=2545717 RepID=UPI0035D6F484
MQSPLLEVSTHLFLQLAVILITYQLLWPIFRRLAQVQVIAIMIAGFLLGPSMLGWVWPEAQRWLFPTHLEVAGATLVHPSLSALHVVGQLGLIMYMFLVGASFKLDIVGKHLRQAGATSATGVVVPMVLGGLLGWWLVDDGRFFTERVTTWQGALFLAAAVSVTAFPILAWIIYDSGLVNTRLGTMALACAAVDDACAWILLAVVVATANDDPISAYIAVGGGFAYLGFMFLLARNWLTRLNSWRTHRGDVERSGGIPVGPLTVMLAVVLLAACLTDFVGIHSVVGAFVAGVVMPRGQLLDKVVERFEPVVGHLLLPAFFIYTGLNTQFSLIFEPAVLVAALVVLVVSFVSKFGAVGLVARFQGMTWREAGAMGALANARGLMELVLLNIGLDEGLITSRLYTILAIMTTVTTFVATPLQRAFERNARKYGLVFGPTGEQSAMIASGHSVNRSGFNPVG